MKSSLRLLGLALLLLGAFLSSTFTLQWWLGRQTRQLQAEAVQFRRSQLEQLLAQLPSRAGRLDEATLASWGGVLGGRLAVIPRGTPAGRTELGTLVAECPLPGQPDRIAQLSFAPIASQKLANLHLQVITLTICLALLLLAVPVVLAFSRREPAASSSTNTPWRQASSTMSSLTEMARLSVERGDQLAHESGARQRAEEDLQTSRSLLDQSHSERIRLGRELHDNICQTLYATCLTLESVGKKLPDTPATTQRLDQCIAELRRLNQEVRAYLSELEPGEIQRQSFTEALDRMLATLPGDAGVHFVRQVEDPLAALIPPAQTLHVVGLLREALSNALRHAGARTITLRAERDEQTVILAVLDDGAGFTPAARLREGHGLSNMQARAREMGATLRIESAPGKGTRVLLLLPVASPA